MRRLPAAFAAAVLGAVLAVSGCSAADVGGAPEAAVTPDGATAAPPTGPSGGVGSSAPIAPTEPSSSVPVVTSPALSEIPPIPPATRSSTPPDDTGLSTATPDSPTASSSSPLAPPTTSSRPTTASAQTSPPHPPATPITTTKASTRTTAAPAPSTVDGQSAPWKSAYDWAWFQSPSGNISCMLGALGDGGRDQAICEIKHHTYPTPTSSSCDLDYGDRFLLGTAGKAILGCHGDTIANDAAAVLPYGTSIIWGALTCTSSESGMWCGDLDTGHHFKVASAAYELG